MRERLVDQVFMAITRPRQDVTERLLFTESARPAPGPLIPLPAGMSGHDYAVFLLHIAAEIEHALMVQYLYAAYSLGGADVPEQHREVVSGWQTVLLGIAKEEMAHFVTVQNILRLIGGPLNLEREDYPWDLPFSPFAFTLEPLTRASLARYVFVESPVEWPSDVAHLEKEIKALAEVGQPRKPNQVGALYSEIIRVLGDKSLVPETMFRSETLPFQAAWDEWGRGYRDGARGGSTPPGTPDLIVQTAYSRSTAIDALRAVAEQGEAADIDPGSNEKSHFRRFLDIFEAFPKDDASWSATMPLAVNPTTVAGLAGTVYLDNKGARLWAELLNLRYRILLTFLAHSFRLAGQPGQADSNSPRGMVLNNCFGEMYSLRAISRLLVAMPCGSDMAVRAGPTFEMPYTIELPAAEPDVWRVHIDLLDAASTAVSALVTHAAHDARRFLEALREIDADKKQAIERILAGYAARGAGVPS